MSEDKLQKLVDELSSLTVLDMAKLKELLEDKWGVKAAAAAAPMMMAAPAGDAGAAEEEVTDFELILTEFPADKKIGVIKLVREITGLGLKEAKDLVESAPKSVKESAPKDEADEIVKKFADIGAKIEKKPA
ncbi:MAG: 50S ribosomal protein L7/L12 [Simkaniaceae bacterium]